MRVFYIIALILLASCAAQKKQRTCSYFAVNEQDSTYRTITQSHYDGMNVYNDNEPVHINRKGIIVPKKDGWKQYKIIYKIKDERF